MTPLPRWRRLGATTVVLVLVACSGGEPDPIRATEAQIKALADDARNEGYDRQADRLADGSVTESEYREGLTDALVCMEAQGLTVSGVTRSETVFGFQLEAGFEPGPSSGDAASVTATSDACQNEHYIYLAQAWVYETGQTYTARARPLIVDCLKKHGYDADGIVDYADVHEVVGGDDATYAGCQREVTFALNGRSPTGEPLESGG